MLLKHSRRPRGLILRMKKCAYFSERSIVGKGSNYIHNTNIMYISNMFQAFIDLLPNPMWRSDFIGDSKGSVSLS